MEHGAWSMEYGFDVFKSLKSMFYQRRRSLLHQPKAVYVQSAESRIWSMEYGFDFFKSLKSMFYQRSCQQSTYSDFESYFGTSATEVVYMSIFYAPSAEGGQSSKMVTSSLTSEPQPPKLYTCPCSMLHQPKAVLAPSPKRSILHYQNGPCSILQEHIVLSLTFIIFEKNAP